MKLKFMVSAFAMLSASGWANAQESSSPAQKGESVSRRMYIDPSSTTVSSSKVNLIVTPLTHKGGVYRGNYQIKVVPYFFKNENGTLILEASDIAVHKLLKGNAINFTGSATAIKHPPKPIVGKAVPSTDGRGSVRFSVATKHGPMVFDTFYHFGP